MYKITHFIYEYLHKLAGVLLEHNLGVHIVSLNEYPSFSFSDDLVLIKNLSRTDNGRYRCHAYSDQGKASSDYINIRVQCEYFVTYNSLYFYNRSDSYSSKTK